MDMASVAPSADITAATPSAESATPQTVEELCAVVGTAGKLRLAEYLPDKIKPPRPIQYDIFGVLFCLAFIPLLMYLKPLDFPDVLLMSLYPLVCAVGALMWRLRILKRRRASAPVWLVNFDARTFTPIGKSGEETITVNPIEYSLGCYLSFSGSGLEDPLHSSYLLELRHIRKGPIAQICWLGFPAIDNGLVSPADLARLDECVLTLTQRLGISRSGAPLSAATSLARK